jgi:hypothetical protein
MVILNDNYISNFRGIREYCDDNANCVCCTMMIRKNKYPLSNTSSKTLSLYCNAIYYTCFAINPQTNKMTISHSDDSLANSKEYHKSKQEALLILMSLTHYVINQI